MASLHFAICAALLLLGAANPNGIKRRLCETRVGGGNVSNIENMPYMVSLQESGRHFCGGSILNPCYVLTSAECVAGKDPEALTIRGGSPYLNESANEYAARSIIIHPKFSRQILDYNVALIQIRAPIEFGDTVQPIPLVDQEPKLEEPLTVAGWGRLKNGGEFQRQIHFAIVEMAEILECARIYDSRVPYPPNDRIMCTYKEMRGACDGDDGGPAVYNKHVAGIITSRTGCGMIPDIHTNMANPEIREFIRKNVREDCK